MPFEIKIPGSVLYFLWLSAISLTLKIYISIPPLPLPRSQYRIL